MGLGWSGDCLAPNFAARTRSARAGRADNVTRQAIRGRVRGGAIRFGNMEVSAMLSGGRSNILLDRMMAAADEFNPPICVRCGDVALFNAQTGTLKCDPCGVEISDKMEMGQYFATTHLPYAFMKAKHGMAGLGQRATFELGSANM